MAEWLKQAKEAHDAQQFTAAISAALIGLLEYHVEVDGSKNVQVSNTPVWGFPNHSVS